jgi:Polyketide cyclase / dehydrase and lipid transport
MHSPATPAHPICRCLTAVAAVLSLCGLTIAAQAADVSSEVTFAADVKDVWAAIGPFCAIGDWYPGLESCSEEQVDGATLRHLVAGDGSQFLEKLVSQDDDGMSYTYTIEEGPLPVADYVSTISVSQSDDQTLVEWSGTFEPDGATEAEAVDVVTGIYETGLDAIRQRFAK